MPSPNLDHGFFSGIGGGGMSALAWYLRQGGRAVSGSDRLFDRNGAPALRAAMEAAGIMILPQDGSGPSPEHTVLVVSTAIEGDSPEVARARELGIPVLHRSELLAHLAAEKKTIAVAGTSGKSTVTAMTWHVLEAGGLGPSLITGANLNALTGLDLPGNAVAGAGDFLVIEADESDGSLVRYHPEVAVLLNIEKDHQEIEALMPLFRTFREQAKRAVIHQGDPRCLGLKKLGDAFFDGMSAGGLSVRDAVFGEWETTFTLDGVRFGIAAPGRHNLENALAAVATGRLLGVPLADCARGLRDFRGVERRWTRVGAGGGVTVIDDFAHNPAKVAAALATAKGLASGENRRVLAIFHPHGFAPMKLVGRDIMEAAAAVLGPDDRLYLPDIYYAGGTADASISSADLVDHFNAVAVHPVARHVPAKDDVISVVAAEARPGDRVLSMGARDPGLAAFARRVLAALGGDGGDSPKTP